MAGYWIVNPGQIAPYETVSLGFGTREEAERQNVRNNIGGRVAYLLVTESEYPIEDERYRPMLSVRYCIVEKSKTGPNYGSNA